MPTKVVISGVKKALPRARKIRIRVSVDPATKKIPYTELTAFRNRVNRGVDDLEAGIGILQNSFAGKIPLAMDIYATRQKTPVRVQALQEGADAFTTEATRLQTRLAELSELVRTRTNKWMNRPN